MKTVLRFVKMAKKYYGVIILASLGLIGASLLNLATPEIVRRLTAALSVPANEGGADSKLLLTLCAALVCAYLLKVLCRWTAMSQSHVAAWRFVGDLTLKCYDKLQSFSMRYYSDKQTGVLMSTMVNDTRQLELLIAHSLPDLISNLLLVISVAIVLFTINPTLALLTMIPVPIVVFVSSYFSKKVSPLFKINQRVLAELNGTLQDNLSGIREIQAFGREQYEHERMTDRCKYYSFVNIRANYANALFQPSVEFFTSLGTVIVLGCGGLFVTGGNMSVADIVGFFMYLSLFYTPLAALSRLVEDVQLAVAGGERVLMLLDTQPDITDAPDAADIGVCRGDIAFEDVSFSYNENVKVLDHVSFKAPAGQMTALVGATGVGKTTIISLLERFYEPDGGKVTLDGRDLRSITIESLRSNISMVLQDVFLFNGTIYENIAYGKEDATREEVRLAAITACADDFICGLPDGYETQIGERGMKLSGGQKQRLAIARAVLRNTPVIVLDEATSAVDTETEAKIQSAIENLSEGSNKRTLIVIAHRLSTVRRADNILVVDDGKIAENGTHDELLRRGGIYSKLCGVQSDKVTK